MPAASYQYYYNNEHALRIPSATEAVTTTTQTASSNYITPAPILPFDSRPLRLHKRQTSSSSSISTVSDPLERKCLISCPAGSRCLTFQESPNYGGCCPYIYTTCDLQTTCMALSAHSATFTFTNTYASVMSGTMFCGVSAPQCQTLIYEDAVSYGKGLTVAHCVPQSDYVDTPNGIGFYACLDWTTGGFCSGSTMTSTSSAGRSATVSRSTLVTPTAPANESAIFSAGHDSSHVSKGTAAGIAVGTFLAGVAVAMVVLYLLWRYWRGTWPQDLRVNPQPVELAPTEYRAEMPYTTAMELDAAAGTEKPKEKGDD